MRRCNELGLVETIYEADHEEEGDEEEEEEEDERSLSDPASSFTISPVTFSSVNLTSTPRSFPSSTPDMQAIVDGWSKEVGYNSDVVIRVYGDCFFLHREPMTSCSRYLRRRLAKVNDVSVSPPLNITVETFTDVARFCYTGILTLTPLNLAAVAVAADLLEIEGGVGEGNLARRMEEFFRREIAGDEEKVEAVLCSCVGILPGAGEAAAALAARCVQVLKAAAEGEDGGDEWIGKLMEISADSFGMIMESMARWSVHDHDHLYRIADRYFGVNRERLTDEEKLRICRSIDCTKLSHHLLLHLVQNSRLPLRFIFKAMLLPHPTTTTNSQTSTLGDLLHSDAAARQASNLAVRIESLERDVAGLRRRLRWSEEKRLEMESGGRAESFRFLRASPGENAPDPTVMQAGRSVRKGRGLGRKLVEGFRRLFRRDKEGEGAKNMMMNKYLAFY